ncbi:L-lactate MFS transporter [Youngiibacter multivorans]|uniref:OFA family oxalate/formate antiporter-like MFS transporter n=1 Tax=Youngiibacter multivorans TaxID=937251 RepID=A0ABS4G4F8_9CLOT|nr:OFA family MFS transporter [Youngiibacter multivorans]MBP1919421.1 OFA family oxalate/formate antiporter-like MFS transporter [Youngiibacter multivorans]
MSNNKTNRWLILFTGIFANLCVGAALAWSVFRKPLMVLFGASVSQVTIPYTLSLALMPISMIIAGRIQDKRGPKLAMFIGGLILSASYFLSGYATNIQFLYITYGILGGASLGAVYSCTVVNTVKWFPDKRGLAGGLIAAGLGAGSIIFAPLGVSLMKIYSPLITFQIFGVIFLIVISFASIFAVSPPAGYKPEGWTPPISNLASINSASSIDKSWKDMLKDPLFYIAWVALVLACVSGLMIIGHAATIGQEVVGLSPAVAAIGVSILGIANASGRAVWGIVSDKLGRFPTVSLIFLVSALSMFLLSYMASTFLVFVISIVGIGSCYGGFFGIYPAITGEMFGLKNMGMNWGVMFTAFAPAAIFGPLLAAQVRVNYGDYSWAFIIAGGLSILGIILTRYAQSVVKKNENSKNNKVA